MLEQEPANPVCSTGQQRVYAPVRRFNVELAFAEAHSLDPVRTVETEPTRLADGTNDAKCMDWFVIYKYKFSSAKVEVIRMYNSAIGVYSCYRMGDAIYRRRRN